MGEGCDGSLLRAPVGDASKFELFFFNTTFFGLLGFQARMFPVSSCDEKNSEAIKVVKPKFSKEIYQN